MSRLYAVIGDVHGPWCDDIAVNLFLDICKDVGITDLVINGDFVDFYNINAHGPKDPEIQSKLDDEFIWAGDMLDHIKKKLPGVQITWIYGNHEYRLDRFVMANCPAFYNHLKLEKMLRLDERGVDWIPYNERFKIGPKLYCQHSPPSYSENAASTSFKKKFDEDHIWGCAHRPDRVIRRGSSGTIYESHILGWFGRKDIILENQRNMPENNRVFKFTKNHEGWACSFAITDGFHIQHILMKNYQCHIGGHIYEA